MPTFPPPIDPSYVPSVSLTKIHATAPINDILAVLERDGALILTDIVSVQDVAAINDELEPYIQKARVETHTAYDLIPKQTIMVPGIVGKSPTMAKIAEFEVIDKLRTMVLQKKCTATWEDRTEEFTIGPLLNSSLTYHISYGGPRQRLHRDDMIHGIYHSGEYLLSNETMLGFMIAGSKTTRENGATMAIPGSHKWDHTRVPKIDQVCFAEMDPGSAFVFLGTVYHGGGHNSVPNEVRKLYGLFFISGTLRPEENQFLAIPRSKVLVMSEKMLSLLGYKKPETWLGIVNNGDPAENLEEVFNMASS
ncbi:Dioxygenase swnH1 [Neonectria magnoliae]|uniref:Dioxygenase swnH1 n=1 Tax=Neonectria magnoliae TaxID=2732573 RepID=A0ABR1I7F2_9HYPO